MVVCLVHIPCLHKIYIQCFGSPFKDSEAGTRTGPSCTDRKKKSGSERSQESLGKVSLGNKLLCKSLWVLLTVSELNCFQIHFP